MVTAIDVGVVPALRRVKVTLPGTVPLVGLIVNAELLTAVVIAAAKALGPVRFDPPAMTTLADVLQDSVRVVGATVSVAVVMPAASPFAPCTDVSRGVSIVRPVESVTINATVPQPLSWAVNLPPLVATLPGLTDATVASGDTTL